MREDAQKRYGRLRLCFCAVARLGVKKELRFVNSPFTPVILKQISLLILIAAAVFFIYSIRSYDGVQTLVIKDVPQAVQKNETADLQVFVEDHFGEPITTANVVGHYVLNEHEVDVQFHHKENGLYEGEILLFVSGQWRGEVRANTFSSEEKLAMIVDVN